MSFDAYVEIILQLENFKNLELREPGIYQLRFRIYYEKMNKVLQLLNI